MLNHEIDYQLYGEEMQFVEIELDPQETVIAESGSFMMMDDGIEMQTIFGDGSGQEKGILGKLFSAGKRLLTGESLFMTAFTNVDVIKRKVSFAAPYAGKIIPLDLYQLDGKVVCQKDAFLCAAKGVSVGIELQRKLGTGLFGGEGFIMQKLEGDGMAFVHSGGMVVRKNLQVGETLRVDTGCVVAYTHRIDFDIEFIGGYSLQGSPAPAPYGSKACPSAAWPTASCAMAEARAKRKAVCLAASATCSMAMASDKGWRQSNRWN